MAISEVTKIPGGGLAANRDLGRKLITNRAIQIIAVEIVLIAVFFSLSPDGAFLNQTNLRGMALTASQVILLAVGQAVLMSAGQIDISQGAAVILSSVVAGKVMLALQGDYPLAVVVLLGLVVSIAIGTLIGLANGLLVGVVKINALVTTLGTLGVMTGIAQVVTGGVNLSGMPAELSSEFGQAYLGALPLPMLASMAVVGVVWLLFRVGPWGTHTLAMGSNFGASRRVGIATLRNTLAIFILSSALAGLAGFIDLSRYSTTNISGHLNDSMAAIAAALIGGTALTGGRISFLGAIFGAFLAIILQSGLVIINLSPFYQTIAIGLMLLVAVSVDRGRDRRRDD
ncbi:monosaccharide ABC transporter membrane protein, CUT2 family [Micromonospora pallida]|uniref:Autoinducer 2 import system permease protein LsrC n=1 Tax=Micromonospora pallida TaxID=145854 RepID=A0A1C6T5U7_9ACTN|nr:ABC transporter permease [Micromonospora pallida]SCL37009.1 monosaccharide ABC transporter membrane protein, CUT2 family [Micromonospora pallida]